MNMAFFKYRGRDEKGKMQTGLVEAPNEQAAVRLIRERKLMVISLRQTTEHGGITGSLRSPRGASFGDIVNFTRQLSTMVVAGLTLPESLNILSAQTTKQGFQQMLQDIQHQIVAGGNLADALSKYPSSFSPIYVALIRAGETSGTLDTVLSQLADNLEYQREFRGKITGAMIYPIIVLIAMTGVIIVMMIFVVPKLTVLYKDFGIELPASTKLLIAVSNFFARFWWLVILSIPGFFIAMKKWRATESGVRVVDAVLLKIPLVGDLIKKSLLVDFTRTLGMLVSSGIHILEGLRVLRDSLGNFYFRDAVDTISQNVEKGLSLGDMFAEYDIFPPIVSQMTKVGEETGKLDQTLTKLSRYFEQEVDHLVKGLLAAMEPLIIVVMAVVVGFVVFSIITPIFKLTEAIQ